MMQDDNNVPDLQNTPHRIDDTKSGLGDNGVGGKPRYGELRAGNVIPDRFGNWIVVKRLNGGAQADVYRVQKDDAAAPHIIKVLKPWAQNSKQSNERAQRERFLTEVTALKTLEDIECPQVVRVVDSNLALNSEEPLWFVMPFYEAGAMRVNTLDGQPGDFSEQYTGAIDRVLSIAADLAETVSVMHSCSPQIIHRDIHTQNIFFDSLGGSPILGDFGIAAIGELPESGGTLLAESFGPRRWRPPEMRSGVDDKRDSASDVYMIGGVIYEALSGGVSIEETEDLKGRYVHEKQGYGLENYSDDQRVPFIAMMLRRCFARHSDARFSASELRKACIEISGWKLGELPPKLGERQARMKATEERAQKKSRSLWVANQRVELVDIVNSVKKEVVDVRSDVTDQRTPGQFWTHLAINGYQQKAENALNKHTDAFITKTPAACIVIQVSFDLDSTVSLMSSIIIWRDEQNEYVAFVSEQEGELQIMSSSFHGDPGHFALIRQTVAEEIDRLQDLAVIAVEEAIK